MTRQVAALCAALCLPFGPPAAAQELPALNLDVDATTVSGLSSGAYMAGQFHVAHSNAIAGAGLLAGGPYDCARGGLVTALTDCMDTDFNGPDIAQLVQRAQAAETAGTIDPLASLAADRVYIFSGTEDDTVVPAVHAAAAEFYRAVGVPEGRLRVDDEIAAGHGLVTPEGEIPCSVTGSPYLNRCGEFDTAGVLLRHLLELPPDASPGTPDDASLVPFSQAPFLEDISDHGLAETGFAYVPEACRDGALCRLHIAFHGCQQSVGTIGDAFITRAGYNGWAEAHDIVVLYPQIQASAADGNPNGCWDWWGYDDPDYATKSGPQMLAVARMAERLGVDVNGAGIGDGGGTGTDGFCVSHDTWNWQHWAEGRAGFCGFWLLCAVGSGDLLGPPPVPTVLFETSDGGYHLGNCPN